MNRTKYIVVNDAWNRHFAPHLIGRMASTAPPSYLSVAKLDNDRPPMIGPGADRDVIAELLRSAAQ